MKHILPNLRAEVEKRLQLLSKAKNNPKLQSVEIEMCRRNIFHWFDNYVYTDRNKTLFTEE